MKGANYEIVKALDIPERVKGNIERNLEDSVREQSTRLSQTFEDFRKKKEEAGLAQIGIGLPGFALLFGAWKVGAFKWFGGKVVDYSINSMKAEVDRQKTGHKARQ